MESEIINGKEYRVVTLRERTKLIARDGDAINYYRRNQKATIHYNTDNYPCYGGGIPVHLYVAYAQVDGYFEGAEVNHKDFDRNNFNADNLEWISHRNNIIYSKEYNSEVQNKSKQGIHNGRAMYTEDEIRQIRKLYDEGKTIAEITEIYKRGNSKSSWSTIANICYRNTWKNVE